MQKTFQYTDGPISYLDAGKGLPVVLLHGFGEDADVWNEQIAFLKNHCRLIVPHLPGSGLSVFTNEDSNTAATIEYYADAVHALLEHENINSCLMLGHSMGGYITLAFAEKYPGLLKGFGLIHSTAFADSEEKKQTRLKGISMMEEYGGYAFLKNTTPNLFASKFKAMHPEKIEALIETGKSFSVRALQQYYKAMMNRPDRTQVLKDSEVPVLFVLGTEDVAAPMQDVLKQTHLPKISFVHILEDTGHMGMWEDSKKMNDALFEFITDVNDK
jgi:pimeloyl-ACP methyl ester carboxylesterase